MGMPTEGTLSDATVKSVVQQVPVCRLGDNLSNVKSRISSESDLCVVIDQNRIVLGLVDLAIVRDDEGPIEDVMKPAPLTLRPSVLIVEALHYFRHANLAFALVTKSTGELMGGFRISDLEGWQTPP
jgi:Mg/Co/Ni transporter MgtE